MTNPFNAYNQGSYDASNGSLNESLPPSAKTEFTVQWTGKLDVGKAIGWGFKAVFGNWMLWILGTLIVLVAYVALCAVSAVLYSSDSATMWMMSDVIDLATGIVATAMSPFIMRLALHQIDNPNTTWRDCTKGVRFWPTIGVNLAIVVVSTIILAIVIFLALLPFLSVEFGTEPTGEEIFAIFGAIFLGVLIICALFFFVAPFILLMEWMPVEGFTGFGGAFGAGFKLGARNYWHLLAFTLVVGVITTAGVLVTIGFGVLVLMPFSVLATAHVYRQVIGGQIPADWRKA